MENIMTEKANVIRYFSRSFYGKTNFYAVDKAYAIERLTGKKTLTAETFAAMEALGFVFEEVCDPEVKRPNMKLKFRI